MMIVDDDEDFLTVMSLTAKNKNIIFITAENSIKAIQQINNHNPDLILLDVFLDHESGLKLCRDIKKISDAKIIMMSGAAPSEVNDLSKLYGADLFLQKPFAFSEVENFIKQNHVVSHAAHA